MLKDESEEIIDFVKKSKNGRRWTDFEKHFCSKSGKWSWSKGKFVNHWKEAKPHLEKKRVDNLKGQRYFIKESFENEATKIVLSKIFKEQELNTINIPKEDMQRALEWIAKHHMKFTFSETGILKGSFFKGYKLSHSYENLFLNFWLENLKEDSEFCDILIQHPLGVHTPQLNKSDKYHLLRVLSYLIASRSSIEDVEKRGFNIILSYNPSLREESGEERQERLNNRVEAWKKDKGVKTMKNKDVKKFAEDYKKMRKLFLDITGRQND